jgi:hypothetical protein
MKAQIHGLLAAFDSEASCRSAMDSLREAGFVRIDAYTPYPVEPGLLRETRSPIAPIMLISAIIGACGGFYLQWYAARDYPINVGGRPINSWPAFVPITFELTVLTSALVGVIAFLFLTGLPRLHHSVFADARFKRASQDRFFICVRASDPLYDSELARRTLAAAKPESVEEVVA